MFPRVAVFAAAVAFWSGAALAAPETQAVTPGNRAQLIAQRMSSGESYDQAARAVPQATDERDQQIATEMAKGKTYRQARLTVAEEPEIVSARWNRHATAMVNGGSHEAGWAASAR